MNKLFTTHLPLEAKEHLKMAFRKGVATTCFPRSEEYRLLCLPNVALGLDI